MKRMVGYVYALCYLLVVLTMLGSGAAAVYYASRGDANTSSAAGGFVVGLGFLLFLGTFGLWYIFDNGDRS